MLLLCLGVAAAAAALHQVQEGKDARRQHLAEFGEIENPDEIRREHGTYSPIQLFLAWGVCQFLAVFVYLVPRGQLGRGLAGLFWLLWLAALIGPFIAMRSVL